MLASVKELFTPETNGISTGKNGTARVRHGHYITLFMLIQDILERSRTSGRGNDISGSF